MFNTKIKAKKNPFVELFKPAGKYIGNAGNPRIP